MVKNLTGGPSVDQDLNVVEPAAHGKPVEVEKDEALAAAAVA
jgi:hypothetical protein